MEKNVFCVAVKTFITNNVEIQPFELMNRDEAKTNGLKRWFKKVNIVKKTT